METQMRGSRRADGGMRKGGVGGAVVMVVVCPGGFGAGVVHEGATGGGARGSSGRWRRDRYERGRFQGGSKEVPRRFQGGSKEVRRRFQGGAKEVRDRDGRLEYGGRRGLGGAAHIWFAVDTLPYADLYSHLRELLRFASWYSSSSTVGRRSSGPAMPVSCPLVVSSPFEVPLLRSDKVVLKGLWCV